MKKMQKIALGAVVGGLAATVVIVLIVLVSINSVARQAVEFGGTTALGVQTTLQEINIRIFGGEVSLAGLKVANPQGFQTPHFLALGKGSLQVTLGSLSQDTVEAPKLELSDIDLNLESSKGQSNYSIIIANANKSKPKQDSQGGSAGKKFVIRELVIRNVTVHADLIPGVKESKLTVNLPEIRLTDFGSESKNGVVLQELMPLVTKAILEAVADKLAGQLPKDLGAGLKGAVAELNTVGKVGAVVAEEMGKKTLDMGKDMGKDVGKEAGKAVEGLGNLLGGDKKK